MISNFWIISTECYVMGGGGGNLPRHLGQRRTDEMSDVQEKGNTVHMKKQ